jgi:hypothetical protein
MTSVICYRVYEVNKGEEMTPWDHWFRPAIGVPKQALFDPFHAFVNLRHLAGWLKVMGRAYRVYKCKLESELTGGYWVHSKIRTVTGRRLTILRDISEEVAEMIRRKEYVQFNGKNGTRKRKGYG